MKGWRGVLMAVVLPVVWLLSAGTAAAHNGGPVRSYDVQIGPYPVTVNYYNEPRGGQVLRFTVVPKGKTTLSQLTATAVPGTLVNAVPVKARILPDSDNAAALAGEVNLPVSGQWLLNLDATGALGPGMGDAPIVASSPAVMPEWMGWLIGLIPFWVMVGFLAAQARRATRLAVLPA